LQNSGLSLKEEFKGQCNHIEECHNYFERCLASRTLIFQWKMSFWNFRIYGTKREQRAFSPVPGLLWISTKFSLRKIGELNEWTVCAHPDVW
jgi:hypothetical protein